MHYVQFGNDYINLYEATQVCFSKQTNPQKPWKFKAWMTDGRTVEFDIESEKRHQDLMREMDEICRECQD